MNKKTLLILALVISSLSFTETYALPSIQTNDVSINNGSIKTNNATINTTNGLNIKTGNQTVSVKNNDLNIKSGNTTVSTSDKGLKIKSGNNTIDTNTVKFGGGDINRSVKITSYKTLISNINNLTVAKQKLQEKVKKGEVDKEKALKS